MATYVDGSYSCTTGLAIIAQAIAGELTINFSRATIGSGTLDCDPSEAEEVAGYVMDANIASVSVPSDGQCQITVQASSDDVSSELYATGVMVYVNDADGNDVPFTYLYLENSPEYIRSASSAIGKTTSFGIVCAIGDVDTVTASIDDGAYASAVDFEALKEDFESLLSEGETVGSGTNPVYLESGILKASAETVGSTSQPVFLNNGVITECDSVIPFTLAIVDETYGYYDTDGEFHSFRQPTGDAEATDVLSGKAFANADSDYVVGEMAEYSGEYLEAVPELDADNSILAMPIPQEGHYDTESSIGALYSTISDLIGLTAAKLASGEQVLDITGEYTDDATAEASDILSGETAYVAGEAVTGTMANYESSTKEGTVSVDSSNSRVRMSPNSAGYYGTSAYIYDSYSDVASAIGLTAAKLAKGNSVLGITGTKTWSWSSINAFSYYSSYATSYDDSYSSAEASFTMPGDGYVYYSGLSVCFYNAEADACTGTCRIYIDGTLKDSRDIDYDSSDGGHATQRTTMTGKSVSVSSGSVIKVVTTATAGDYYIGCWMQAECVYFS